MIIQLKNKNFNFVYIDKKGNKKMRKYRICYMLVLVLLSFTGCSSNIKSEESQNQTSESSVAENSKEIDEDVKTQSISEHFTNELTNEEIWFEVSATSSNEISPTEHITALLLTDEGYHDTGYGDAFWARGFKGDGGYIYVPINNNAEENNPQVNELYEHFVNGTLKQIIYENYLEESIVNKRRQVLGKSYTPQSSKELSHQLVLDSDSKFKYQRMIFKGEETINTTSNRNAHVRYIFNITEDSIIIPMSSISYPTAYLVGVKGNNMNDSYEDRYFVKFSNEKEKYVLDALYTDANVEMITEDD